MVDILPQMVALSESFFQVCTAGSLALGACQWQIHGRIRESRGKVCCSVACTS